MANESHASNSIGKIQVNCWKLLRALLTNLRQKCCRGSSNQTGIVKVVRIGQSAAKHSVNG